MNRFFRILLSPGAAVAPVQFVFLSVVVVSAMQFSMHSMFGAERMLAGIVANEVVAVLGVPLALILAFKYDFRRLIPVRSLGVLHVAMILLATLAAAAIIDYMTAASEIVLPLPADIKAAMKNLMAAGGPSPLVLKLFVLCVLPGICEEIYFRGFCQTSLSARFGAGWALVAQAVIFSLMHGNPWYAHLYFILGLFLGGVYMMTGNIVAPIICHIINNTWTVLTNYYGFRLPMQDPFGIWDAVLIAVSAAILVIVWKRLSTPKQFLTY